MGNVYSHGWGRHTLSLSLKTGQRIDIERYYVDNVFPPDDIWFSSDTLRIVQLPMIRCYLTDGVRNLDLDF